MSDEIKWAHVYTGSDLRATLLKNELEGLDIPVSIQSDKDAGLHSGFGPSGISQVFVREADATKALEHVRSFEEKMK